MNRVKDFLFKTLFYWDYVHLQELIGDVIRLERELAKYRKNDLKIGKSTTGSNGTTYFKEEKE